MLKILENYLKETEKNSKKFWNISQSLYLFIFNLKLSMKEKKEQNLSMKYQIFCKK